jgi:hypothetical protein
MIIYGTNSEIIIKSTRAAEIISKISNPCIVSILYLLIITFTQTDSIYESLAWIGVIVLFLVLLPLGYLLLKTYLTNHQNIFTNDPTDYLRRHPKDILILAIVFGIPSIIILTTIKASPFLLYILSGLLLSALIAAAINLRYRVSFHLSGITFLVFSAVTVWGRIFFIFLVAVLIIAWAKYRIKAHTLPQIIFGILIGFVIYFVLTH